MRVAELTMLKSIIEARVVKVVLILMGGCTKIGITQIQCNSWDYTTSFPSHHSHYSQSKDKHQHIAINMSRICLSPSACKNSNRSHPSTTSQQESPLSCPSQLYQLLTSNHKSIDTHNYKNRESKWKDRHYLPCHNTANNIFMMTIDSQYSTNSVGRSFKQSLLQTDISTLRMHVMIHWCSRSART